MTALDSTLDTAALGHARALLKPRIRRQNPMSALGAAFFAACAALSLAAAVIAVPPVISPGTAGLLTPALAQPAR